MHDQYTKSYKLKPGDQHFNPALEEKKKIKGECDKKKLPKPDYNSNLSCFNDLPPDIQSDVLGIIAQMALIEISLSDLLCSELSADDKTSQRSILMAKLNELKTYSKSKIKMYHTPENFI
jgi:hypothetical protein